MIHLSDLVGGARGNLLDTERGKLLLKIGELLGKLSQILLAQLKGLNAGGLINQNHCLKRRKRDRIGMEGSAYHLLKDLS